MTLLPSQLSRFCQQLQLKVLPQVLQQLRRTGRPHQPVLYLCHLPTKEDVDLLIAG